MNEPHRLPPGQQRVAPGKWPSVGERAAAPPPGAWQVQVAGSVARPRAWSLEELRALAWVERTVDIHCVTRWSKFDVPFGGVLLADLLAASDVLDEARFVSFVAHSPRAHSTSLPLAVARELGALVVLEHEGRALPAEHGGPVRVVVPGRYFYKSLKWLARVELLPVDRLGYWEQEAGYHNGADPWKEERFIAPSLDRLAMRARLASRDFRAQEILGLAAADQDLTGLDARGAVLRNADFRRARLEGARFDGANLSNARFGEAHLLGAHFVDADLEGADFCGADLRGVDFRGASLLAATFTDGSPGCQTHINPTTRFDAAVLEALCPEQARYVHYWLSVHQ